MIKPITTVDGFVIPSVEVKHGNNAVLLCHGIASSKDEGGFFIALSDSLNKSGFSTFRFDFRGHGDSEVPQSMVTIAGMICDLDRVLDYMARNYHTTSIVAASFGASIFLLLAQQATIEQIRRVILLNPVIDYHNTFYSRQSTWSKSFFPKGGFHEITRGIGEIKIGEQFRLNPLMALEMFYYRPAETKVTTELPMLIIHGAKDQIVAIEDSRIFAGRSEHRHVQIIEFPDSTHGLEEDQNDVFEIVNRFLIEGVAQ